MKESLVCVAVDAAANVQNRTLCQSQWMGAGGVRASSPPAAGTAEQFFRCVCRFVEPALMDISKL